MHPSASPSRRKAGGASAAFAAKRDVLGPPATPAWRRRPALTGCYVPPQRRMEAAGIWSAGADEDAAMDCTPPEVPVFHLPVRPLRRIHALAHADAVSVGRYPRLESPDGGRGGEGTDGRRARAYGGAGAERRRGFVLMGDVLSYLSIIPTHQ
jgi:hypothetical protein